MIHRSSIIARVDIAVTITLTMTYHNFFTMTYHIFFMLRKTIFVVIRTLNLICQETILENLFLRIQVILYNGFQIQVILYNGFTKF